MEQQTRQQAGLSKLPVTTLFETEPIKKKFAALLGKKAQGFITSVLQIVASSEKLQGVAPLSIYNAAATAATLDLPINNNLGFAWIVPYKGKAQFQIGYKGFVQLAQRSGQYLRINVIDVYANQFKKWNELTEELDADFSIEGTGEVVGFCCYLKMINGYEKIAYWTKDKVINHAKKYSKAFDYDDSPWKTEFNKMAKKTLLKNTLSSWGILSIEMQRAIVVDQAVINNEEGTDLTYVDNEEVPGDDNKQKAKKAEDRTINMMDGKK